MHRYLRWTNNKVFKPSLLSLIFIITISIFHPASAQDTVAGGEQLFTPCKACHTLGKGKLIGPDLYGVTKRLDRTWITHFIRNSQELLQAKDPEAVKVWEEHNKIPMPPFSYNDNQMKSLLDYMDSFDTTRLAATAAAKEAVNEKKPAAPSDFFAETEHVSKDYGNSFFISLTLLLIAIIDLLITRIIKARFIHAVVIVISVAIMTEAIVVEAENLGRQPGYEPDQPVLFSHKIHAGQNQINCKYCHFSVTESKNAGIPPVALCMNCHNVVKEGTNTGTAEISKIFNAMASGKPIGWIRVHNLPAHVFFSHAQHVTAGKVQCETCHGDLKSVHRVRQMQALSMGWCIDCHRRSEVNFGNNFYSKYTKLHDELNSGLRTGITVEDIGGTDCSQCHY
jgi:mono/diheme cytochrome c family protein